MKVRLSLKGRGLQLLAQREHSRLELQRKLMKYARLEQAARLAAAAGAAAAPAARRRHQVLDRPDSLNPIDPIDPIDPLERDCALDPCGLDGPSPEEAVEAVLDWLQAHHYLSDLRFVESRVHARSQRYGNLRIRQELAQHGVTLGADDAQALRDSELSRAREVWRRKFGEPASDAQERARQMRFLSGRGFSPEVIRRVVRGEDD